MGVCANVTLRLGEENFQVEVAETTTKQLPVAVAHGLVELTTIDIPVVVLNISEELVVVYKGSMIATISSNPGGAGS